MNSKLRIDEKQRAVKRIGVLTALALVAVVTIGYLSADFLMAPSVGMTGNARFEPPVVQSCRIMPRSKAGPVRRSQLRRISESTQVGTREVVSARQCAGGAYARSDAVLQIRTVCLSLFPWAKFRRAKGGVKAHVLWTTTIIRPVAFCSPQPTPAMFAWPMRSCCRSARPTAKAWKLSQA